jgi:hypothetical protein
MYLYIQHNKKTSSSFLSLQVFVQIQKQKDKTQALHHRIAVNAQTNTNKRLEHKFLTTTSKQITLLQKHTLQSHITTLLDLNHQRGAGSSNGTRGKS